MSDPGGTRRERREHDVVAAQGTRREGAIGTRRESTDAGGTRREIATGTVEFVSVNLPVRLAERFRVVEEIPTQGAEATVMVVEEIESGTPRVLKLYRRGIELDRDAVDRLTALSQSDEGQPHIVTLYEAEVEAGLWYEVQELCPHRSLREVLRARPVDASALASEMAPALVFLEGNLYLRDLKPENLLVRTLEPFDVVVADFGLARNAEAGSVRWTEGGTAAYMPPEAGRNRVTRAWDWWSAGMVLAEVALGRHPLADADGHLPPSLQILDLINSTPVDLTGIADDHLRHLCRGLLVRDPDRRWRAEQVRAWMAGERPEVPDDETTLVTASGAPGPGPRATSMVGFGGTTYDDPRELAAAFQQRWDYALARLFQDRDAAWIVEVETFLRERELTDAAQIVAGGLLAATDLPRRMASLLVEMDPLLDPVFDGVRVTPAGLADAAHAVVSGRQSGLQGQLRQIRAAGVLTLWTSLPGMSLGTLTGDKLDETWQRDCRQLDDLAAGVRGAGQAPPADVLEVAKARLLLCALDPKQQARLQRNVRHRRSLERTVAWWRVLADQARTSLPAAALAVMLAPEAKYAAEQERQREDDTATAASRQRERAVPTPQALGPARRPALLASVPALLLGLLWLAVHFETRIGFFLVSTADGEERRNVLTPDDVGSLVDAAPRIVGLAVACVAVQIVGAWSRERRLSPAAARAYVAVSALVQGAAASVLIVLGMVGIVLGYIANSLDEHGFPEDYVPGSCKPLVVAGAVVLLGAAYLLVVSLRRLALALFGGQVIAR